MADHRRNWPITVVWGDYSEGRQLPAIFDRDLRIIEPFLRYCIWLAEKKLREKASDVSFSATISKAATSLKNFAEFMRVKRLEWNEVNDEHLVAFRNWCCEEIRKDVRSRDDLSAKRTANEKLVCIYQFYAWAQEIEFLILDRIGWPHFPIQSTYPAELRGNPPTNGRRHYPLKYRRVGESSRNKQQYHATDDDLRKIRQHFWEGSSPEKALRDVLLLDLADATGWRAGSLSTVPVDAFSDKVIAEARRSNEDHIWVIPERQKFGYQKAFKVPFPLAVRVNRYCNESRNELLRTLGKDESTACGFVFLSTRTGAPLDHEYISRIFGSALTAIGVRQRAGAHAVRRKFTDDLTAEHHAVRKAQGLSTAPEDVLKPVADALGQQSLHSQESYQRVVMSDIEVSYEHKLKQELQKLGSELATKDHEISRLRKLLVKSSS